MRLRFLFGVWPRNHILSGQLTLAASLGVGDRGHFYGPVGALRDGDHLLGRLSAQRLQPEPARAT
jgi:glucose-6-phosphate 1-dehydrogenase